MKKFKFRLQKVLDFRTSLKDERKRELIAANQRLREAEEELERVERELLRHGLGEGQTLSVEELLMKSRYNERMREAVAQHIEQVALRQAEASEAIQRYIEAAKDANALDTLKNRRFQEYMERIQKHEEQVLDEATVQRAGRALIKEAREKRSDSASNHGEVGE